MGTQGWVQPWGSSGDTGLGIPAETYQIGQQTRAHEGSVFALCRRRDGTVLSGGGKDRRLLSWSPDLTLLQEAEVKTPIAPPRRPPPPLSAIIPVGF